MDFWELKRAKEENENNFQVENFVSQLKNLMEACGQKVCRGKCYIKAPVFLSLLGAKLNKWLAGHSCSNFAQRHLTCMIISPLGQY
jgi:hypothetical protein